MGQSTPIQNRPSIPRIHCPHCGTIMRLAEIGPGAGSSEQMMRFDCDCEFEYRMLCVAWSKRAEKSPAQDGRRDRKGRTATLSESVYRSRSRK